jgi:hypothetical protein
MTHAHGEATIAVMVTPRGTDYWLGHCQGFRVEPGDCAAGVVDHVIYRSRVERPDLLVVRTGFLGRQRRRVPVEAVELVDPRYGVVVLAAAHEARQAA